MGARRTLLNELAGADVLLVDLVVEGHDVTDKIVRVLA